MIKHVPNILTFGRLVLTVVFLVMILKSPYVENKSYFLDIAFVLFIITGLTDMVDGAIARKFNVTSKLGRIMDPLADKVLICGTFSCFAIIGEPTLPHLGLSDAAAKTIAWTILGIIVLRELTVTILRQIAENKGIAFGATVSGKIKMFLQSFAIGTVMVKMAHVSEPWGNWFTIIVYIAMASITIFSGIRAVMRTPWKQIVK